MSIGKIQMLDGLVSTHCKPDDECKHERCPVSVSLSIRLLTQMKSLPERVREGRRDVRRMQQLDPHQLGVDAEKHFYPSGKIS
jgi:hypothetical protein